MLLYIKLHFQIAKSLAFDFFIFLVRKPLSRCWTSLKGCFYWFNMLNRCQVCLWERSLQMAVQVRSIWEQRQMWWKKTNTKSTLHTQFLLIFLFWSSSNKLYYFFSCFLFFCKSRAISINWSNWKPAEKCWSQAYFYWQTENVLFYFLCVKVPVFTVFVFIFFNFSHSFTSTSTNGCQAHHVYSNFHYHLEQCTFKK